VAVPLRRVKVAKGGACAIGWRGAVYAASVQWTLSNLTGEDGELIERLCYTLDQACERYADAAGDVIVQACLSIGAPVQRGEILARNHDAALTHLAEQALQLVEIGVSESFLIRALRWECQQREGGRFGRHWTGVVA
jgi:hypothetical protein